MAPTIPPPAVPIPLSQPRAAIHADPSLWDRVSNWVSENKAVVYTLVGVTVVVTTAGAVYYFKNNSVRATSYYLTVARPLLEVMHALSCPSALKVVLSPLQKTYTHDIL